MTSARFAPRAAATALVLLLSACVTPQERANALFERVDKARPVAQPSTKERRVAVVAGIPLISTSVSDAKHDVAIYVTPSCPTCMILFYDIVLKELLMSTALETTNVSFILVPRVNDDHELIKNLFCVEAQQVTESVSRYFDSAVKLAATRPNFAPPEMQALMNELKPVSAEIAQSYDVPKTTLSQCQNNNAFDTAILAAWRSGWERNRLRDWPLILIDGQPTDYKQSRQLVSHLRGRK